MENIGNCPGGSKAISMHCLIRILEGNVKETAQEAQRRFPSVLLIESNRKSAGDGSGGSWSKFLQFATVAIVKHWKH